MVLIKEMITENMMVDEIIIFNNKHDFYVLEFSFGNMNILFSFSILFKSFDTILDKILSPRKNESPEI